ncbi:MAG: hypothetical protein KGS48_15055, partial [Bacteroidetes bacterium]|nr:hypothetical protein [Bacteroidota bacterium]
APEFIYTAAPEFNLALSALRDSEGMVNYGLWVESIDPYPASNYTILYSVQFNGSNEIVVDILGAQAPNLPQGGPSKAQAFVDLGRLAPGSYALKLNLGNTLHSEGILYLSGMQNTLQIPDAKGIVITNSVLLNIPDHMVWGIVENPGEPSKDAAEHCILDLKAASLEHGLSAGFYGDFTMSGVGTAFPNARIEPAVPYIFFVRRLQAAADTAGIKNILKNYRSPQQAHPLKVHCYSTLGTL